MDPPEPAPRPTGPSRSAGSRTRGARRAHRGFARARAAVRTLVPALVVIALLVLYPSQTSTDDRAVLVLAWLAVALVVTATGLAAYLAWRLDAPPELAWVSAGLLALGLYGAGGAVVALVGLNLADPLPPTTVVDLAVVAVGAGCALAALGRPFPARDPLALGVAVAAVAGALRALLPTLLAPAPGDTGAALLTLAALALAVLAGGALLAGRLPAGMRPSLAAALALGGSLGVVGGALAILPPTAGSWLAAAGLAAATVAAVHCGRTLRDLDRSRQRSLRSLALRATRAEAARQHNQDRMHELRATASGVASASEVLAQQHGELPAPRLAALCELLVDETDRLRRLTQSFERGKVERVALDQVLGRVVGKQRALGQVVRWEPSELSVEADADMLREIVDILLVNAQMHAPGAWVRVNARRRQDKVVVRVRDTGPGVSPDVADRLFERGARGQSSEGSGVGLHLARRLAEEMGGALSHEPTQTGTCFVTTLVLHAEEVGDGAAAAGGHRDARGVG